MSKGKFLLGAAVILFVIYVAAAPYITVYQMRSAAEAYDGQALSEHIDFPSVRQNLKDQMNVMFANKMAQDEKMKGNPFAALGAAFAGVVVDKVVDVYVTPAGISKLMAGEKPKKQIDPESSNTSSDSARKPLADASMSYESFNKFVIKVNNKSGEEGEFILRRRGLSWKLTEIIIPND